MHCWMTRLLAPHKAGWKLPLCSQPDVLFGTGLRMWPLGLERTWRKKKKSGFRGQVGAGWAPGLSFGLTMERGCGCDFQRLQFPLHHPQASMGKCVTKAPCTGAYGHHICQCWGRDPPDPARTGVPFPSCATKLHLLQFSFPGAETSTRAAPAPAEEPAGGTKNWGDAHTERDVVQLQPNQFCILLCSKTTALLVLWR